MYSSSGDSTCLVSLPNGDVDGIYVEPILDTIQRSIAPNKKLQSRDIIRLDCLYYHTIDREPVMRDLYDVHPDSMYNPTTSTKIPLAEGYVTACKAMENLWEDVWIHHLEFDIHPGVKGQSEILSELTRLAVRDSVSKTNQFLFGGRVHR